MTVSAQETIDRNLPEFDFDRLELAGQMYFLASDYLAGRRTGSIGNDVAAEYIAAQLRGYGYAPINGADSSYFQTVPLSRVNPPLEASLRIGDSTYVLGEDIIVLRGPAAEATAQVVYANYGWVDEESGHNDYENLDVRGKIVVTRAGIPGDPGQQGIFKGIGQKAELAAAAGAVAVFEIYSLPYPWEGFRGYLGGERMSVSNGSEPASIPYGFVNFANASVHDLQDAPSGLPGQVMSSGMRVEDMGSRNVGGILRGSDPELADEYLLMTAHFDHVGVGAQGGRVLLRRG